MRELQPTIFIVKNRALGDSIMGLSSVSYFRSLYPKSTIIYAIPQWTAKLYEEVITDADIIYPLKLNSLGDILDLYQDLINYQVNLIHETHQTGTGSKVFGLFSILKQIPYTYHNHHLTSGTKVIDQGEKKELIQRDLDGVYSFWSKSKKVPSFLNFEPKLSIKNGSAVRKNRVIFGVVATRDTKKWPLINFKKLADNLLSEDPTLNISIPLSNSREDLEIKQSLINLNLDSRVSIINLPLNKLPQYFAESKLYIGNDTGLKHLAIACGIPSITLFGPEPTREWHPYSQLKHKALFREGLNCRTRNAHYCGLSKCDLESNTNMQCMKLISVEEVNQLAGSLWQK